MGRHIDFHRSSVEYYGQYQITGTVDEAGVSGAYIVALFDRKTKRVIQTTTSSEAGVWGFYNLRYYSGRYFVVSFDDSIPLVNAAISDFLVPDPM